MSGVGLVVTRRAWGVRAFDEAASTKTQTWALIADLNNQMTDHELHDGVRLVAPRLVFFLGWMKPVPDTIAAQFRCVIVERRGGYDDDAFAKAIADTMAALVLAENGGA